MCIRYNHVWFHLILMSQILINVIQDDRKAAVDHLLQPRKAE